MTTLSSLNSVRYYTDKDIYHYTVDNRPLQDLSNNDAILASAIDNLNVAPVTVSILSDNSTFIPSADTVTLTGGGAARLGCVIGHDATIRDGYHLTVFGFSDSITVTNSTVKFAAGAVNVVFGNTAGQVMCMQLRYLASISKWVEISRTLS